MARSVICKKDSAFALGEIETFTKLRDGPGYIVSGQLLPSGTSIGGNIAEALAGQNRKDFMAKLTVSSRETHETHCWLARLRESRPAKMEFAPALNHVDELIRILTSIVKTTSENPATHSSKVKT
jgi:four helix bundle protein